MPRQLVIANLFSNILTKALQIPSMEVRNLPDIIVKKAGKTIIFVVLNKTEYNTKLEEIVKDHTKF